MQSVQVDSRKGFAYNAEQRDTAVVVTVAAVTLVLVQNGIRDVLRHGAPLPALAEKFMEFGEQHRLGTLNAVTSRGFTVCQAVCELDELLSLKGVRQAHA